MREQHIEAYCHLIRDKVEDNVVILFHIPMHSQLAELTKALSSQQFTCLLSKMSIINIHSSYGSHLKGECQGSKAGKKMKESEDKRE